MRQEKHKIILVSLLQYRCCEPWWSKPLFLLFEHNFKFFHFIVQSWQQSRPVYATLWLLRPDSCSQRCPAASEMEGCKDSASQVWHPWKKHGRDHQAVHAIHRLSHSSKGDILTFIFAAFHLLSTCLRPFLTGLHHLHLSHYQWGLGTSSSPVYSNTHSSQFMSR